MPTNGELVRTTGLCWLCDFRFVNEVVARYSEPSMPGGWAYVELRHLDAAALEALNEHPGGSLPSTRRSPS